MKKNYIKNNNTKIDLSEYLCMLMYMIYENLDIFPAYIRFFTWSNYHKDNSCKQFLSDYNRSLFL